MKQTYVSKSYIQDPHLKKQINIFLVYKWNTHIATSSASTIPDLRVVVSKSHDLHHPMKEELQEQTFVVPDLETPTAKTAVEKSHPPNQQGPEMGGILTDCLSKNMIIMMFKTWMFCW